jgi:hypothetical protein
MRATHAPPTTIPIAPPSTQVSTTAHRPSPVPPAGLHPGMIPRPDPNGRSHQGPRDTRFTPPPAPQQVDTLIIVNESSAKIARRVTRIDPHRHIAAGRRHSTALADNTEHGHSACTPKNTTGSEINHASGRPHSGMAPAGREGGGAPRGAGIPSRRHRAYSRPGAGVEVVQPSGAPPRPPRLACFRTSPPTRRDTHFRPLSYQQNKPPSCCRRAVTRGQ